MTHNYATLITSGTAYDQWFYITSLNDQTWRERVKNQPTKTTVYLAFDQIVFAVYGIRKHFIQCLLEVNNKFTWRNPDYFLLSSTARQVLCLGWFHEWKLLKVSFLPFPSMVATQYKWICWRTQSFNSQSPSDSNSTVCSQ